jgi:hypothetical protein
MFENRSLDDMLGGLYTGGSAPSAVLPAGSAALFDGLHAGLSNPGGEACYWGPAANGVTKAAVNLGSAGSFP